MVRWRKWEKQTEKAKSSRKCALWVTVDGRSVWQRNEGPWKTLWPELEHKQDCKSSFPFIPHFPANGCVFSHRRPLLHFIRPSSIATATSSVKTHSPRNWVTSCCISSKGPHCHWLVKILVSVSLNSEAEMWREKRKMTWPEKTQQDSQNQITELILNYWNVSQLLFYCCKQRRCSAASWRGCRCDLWQ